MTDFSLVLIDGVGAAFFAAAEREALRGLGQVCDVTYVRRPMRGSHETYDSHEILMGPQTSRFELIRAGVERAITPRVAVIEVSALTSFAGGAGLALELLDDDVDLVAAQVVALDGTVLFRDAALALDGTPRFVSSDGLASELAEHRPTLLCDPRAFAADRDFLLASSRGLAAAGETAEYELAWRCWIAGGRAVTSRNVSVVALASGIPVGPLPWKASLARLLTDDALLRTPEGRDLDDAPSIVTRLLREAGLSTSETDASTANRAAVQDARKCGEEELQRSRILVSSWERVTAAERRRRPRIAILCSDAVGTSMAGPAIRSIELARVLSETAEVRVAARVGEGAPGGIPCPLHELSDTTVAELLGWADAIVLQGPLTDWHRNVLQSDIPIAVDLYDPMNLEALESVDPDLLVPYTTNLLHDQLWRGDYFFCASERQRDFWLGMLAASGRITPGRYAENPDLEGLIGIVPYGIPAEPPARVGPGIRSELGIAADDPLFVWNGGIWQWFDPDLLVLAIARLREEIPNVRALFMGVRRPGSGLTDEARRLQALIDEHALRDRNVFVRDWTPYAERADTYLDATGVVSLHHAHIETRFSFRTRLLDCIWAATPIICTAGDVLAPVVRDQQIGITVPAGDLDAIVAALRALSVDHARVDEMRGRLRALSAQFRWDVGSAPLVAWCDALPATRRERFSVTGLDPELHRGEQLERAVEPAGLKLLIPRPLRQHVLGPLKRRIRPAG